MSSAEERIITISTSTLVRAVLLLIVLAFLWFIRDIIALVFAAFVLAALIFPFANWMRRFKVSPAISVLLFYLMLFGGLTLAFVLLIPQIIRQLSELGTVIGSSWSAAADSASAIRDFVSRYGLQQNIQAGITSAENYVGQLVGGVFSTISSLFGGIASLILVLVLAFYMVVGEKESVRWFKNIIPDEYQEYVTNLMFEVERNFSRWLVGQTVLCFVVGACVYLGLTVLGVEGALVLAIFAGFTEIIPYVGPILSGILAVLVAFTQSPMLALLTGILMFGIQELENNILVPKIMQKAVGLNPVISIVAFLVGAKLFGFAGVILSIPIATAASVALMEYFKFVKKTDPHV
jgi:predicted PurR-regulated permease PerM